MLDSSRQAGDSSFKKNGLGRVIVARKSVLHAEGDVVSNPLLNLSDKLFEIRNGYKSIPNYFRPFKADSVD
jgi:hypothetical protein